MFEPHDRFKLTLEVMPDEIDGVLRVRRLLKFALRSCGLRNCGLTPICHSDIPLTPTDTDMTPNKRERDKAGEP